jgi:hypothetical protein
MKNLCVLRVSAVNYPKPLVSFVPPSRIPAQIITFCSIPETRTRRRSCPDFPSSAQRVSRDTFLYRLCNPAPLATRPPTVATRGVGGVRCFGAQPTSGGWVRVRAFSYSVGERKLMNYFAVQLPLFAITGVQFNAAPQN